MDSFRYLAGCAVLAGMVMAAGFFLSLVITMLFYCLSY